MVKRIRHPEAEVDIQSGNKKTAFERKKKEAGAVSRKKRREMLAEDLEPGSKKLAHRAKRDFWIFMTEVLCNKVLDPYFHRLVCWFVEHGETRTLPQGDYFFPTRHSLLDMDKMSVSEFLETYRLPDEDGKPSHMFPLNQRIAKPPTEFNGDFRGIFMRVRGSSFKEVLFPRGHLKTTVCTVGRKLWKQVRNRDLRQLLLMNSGPNAEKTLNDMRSHFERNSVFQNTYPEIIPRHIRDGKRSTRERDRWAGMQFDVSSERTEAESEKEEVLGFQGTREASMTGAGVETRLTSQHYDEMSYDDLVDEKSVTNQDQISKANEKLATLQSLGIGDVTNQFYVGTPYDSEDPSQKLLDPKWSGEDDLSVFMATVKGTDGSIFYPPDYEVHPRHPGITDDKLKKLEKKQRRLGYFHAQYYIQPVGKGGQAFRAKWWKWYTQKPEDVQYIRVATCDPAISLKKQGDYCAFFVVDIDPYANWWIQTAEVYKGLGPVGVWETILAINARWKPMLFGVEAVSFQKFIQPIVIDQAIQRGHEIPPIYEVTKADEANKEFRIKRLAPRVKAGQVYLPAGDARLPLEHQFQRHCCIEGLRVLISQGERFPQGHDDALDALAQVIDMPLVGAIPEQQAKLSEVQQILKHELERQESEAECFDSVLGSEW